MSCDSTMYSRWMSWAFDAFVAQIKDNLRSTIALIGDQEKSLVQLRLESRRRNSSTA